MKPKHLAARIKQCLAIAECSPCPRRKVGSLILDATSNVILVDSYNGSPRGGGPLCGGDACDRTTQDIPSGTHMEIGCHHSEENAICNAARHGVSTLGAVMLVTAEPCAMCARLIHHAGIAKVIVLRGGYSTDDGVRYLERYGVTVEYVDRETTEATPATR